jgi:hypothetical protein
MSAFGLQPVSSRLTLVRAIGQPGCKYSIYALNMLIAKRAVQLLRVLTIRVVIQT